MIFQILLRVTLPIFLIIGLGVLLDRKFRLDLPTMSKLNFYVFVPALTFIKLLEAKVSTAQMSTVGLFGIVHVLLLLAISWLICSHPSLRKQRTVLAMGAIFYNCGNYGIPFVILAFGGVWIGLITTVVVVQNILSYTLGIWMFEHKSRGAGSILTGLLKVPVLHAVVLALILRAVPWKVPAPIYLPLNYLSDGLVPIALLTLGMQLSRTRLTHGIPSLSLVTVMRLMISPIIAALLVIPFGFTGTIAKVLIVVAGFPVAVNLYILAAEYNQDEELASQAIFISTLLSAITLSVLLAIYR